MDDMDAAVEGGVACPLPWAGLLLSNTTELGVFLFEEMGAIDDADGVLLCEEAAGHRESLRGSVDCAGDIDGRFPSDVGVEGRGGMEAPLVGGVFLAPFTNTTACGGCGGGCGWRGGCCGGGWR